MSAAKFTPGPQWTVAPRPWAFSFVRGLAAIVDADGLPVAFVSSTRGKFEAEKVNAEHIAQCVNERDDLLEALTLCVAVCAGETMNKGGLIYALEKARAAIAKATGSAS